MANKKVIMSVTASAAIASAIFAAEEAEAATHTVKSGDSLWTIAQKYGTSVSNLKTINSLSSDLIHPNQKIETSKSSQSNSTNTNSGSGSTSTTSNATYVVKSGDSLSVIASKHNISLSNLMAWNNLDTTLIFPGNKLVVKKGGSTSSSSGSSNNSSSGSSSSSSSTTYTVKSGDTLSHIASRNKVSVSNLKKWNNLNSDLIRVGQKLSIKGASNSGSSSSSNSSSNSGKSSTSKVYTVKSGDSLSKIGSQHGVSVASLKSWNNLKSDVIYIGQKLSINGKSSTGGSTSNSGDSTKKESTSYNVTSLINEAKKHQGVPYVWGGQSPSGFDCSGFIHYVYNKAGLTSSRTNTDGYFNRSRYVNNPQVGDLVFFKNTYKTGISHMGIYLGSGNFIHAGSSTGVTIANVNNSYWSKHFDSYKRFY